MPPTHPFRLTTTPRRPGVTRAGFFIGDGCARARPPPRAGPLACSRSSRCQNNPRPPPGRGSTGRRTLACVRACVRSLRHPPTRHHPFVALAQRGCGQGPPDRGHRAGQPGARAVAPRVAVDQHGPGSGRRAGPQRFGRALQGARGCPFWSGKGSRCVTDQTRGVADARAPPSLPAPCPLVSSLSLCATPPPTPLCTRPGDRRPAGAGRAHQAGRADKGVQGGAPAAAQPRGREIGGGGESGDGHKPAAEADARARPPPPRACCSARTAA